MGNYRNSIYIYIEKTQVFQCNFQIDFITEYLSTHHPNIPKNYVKITKYFKNKNIIFEDNIM